VLIKRVLETEPFFYANYHPVLVWAIVILSLSKGRAIPNNYQLTTNPSIGFLPLLGLPAVGRFRV